MELQGTHHVQLLQVSGCRGQAPSGFSAVICVSPLPQHLTPTVFQFLRWKTREHASVSHTPSLTLAQCQVVSFADTGHLEVFIK